MGISSLTVPVVVSGPASAAESCVTRNEYTQVKKGMTKARVHDIFDFSGKVLFSNPGKQGNEAREYRMCGAWKKATGDTRVQVQYNNYATKGGPLRVVYKQHY
ncbi:hypothetical protein [Nocardioides aurantiacus]|uniref:hypothetical protein n=1 Tax=Nocardioides aurantiacus TaxID=86796 RepID=UPI00403F8F8E